MSQNNYCTYFDINFAVYGLALLESIFRHDPNARVYVLCLDEETFELLSKNENKKRFLIDLKSIEKNFPSLSEAKRNRTITEYFWTLTPCVIYFLIYVKKVCDKLTYLDADQFFFSSPKPIFDEIKDAEIAIMPHRFPAEIDYLKEHGYYNVSWLTFRNSIESKKCLSWWMKSCLEWCYAKVDGLRYGDQKYLDQFPIKFKGVKEIENDGCGLAPWNLSSFNFENEIILFHFQSFRILGPNIYSAVIQLLDKTNVAEFKNKVLSVYLSCLKKHVRKLPKNIKTPNSDKSLKQTENSFYIIVIFSKIFFIRNKILKTIFTRYINDYVSLS